VVVVFEDKDTISQVLIETLGFFGVGVILGNPKAAARVPGHRDGVLHIGFGSENRGLKTGWKRKLG